LVTTGAAAIRDIVFAKGANTSGAKTKRV